MMLEELEALKTAAAQRDSLFKSIASIRDQPFDKYIVESLCPELIEAARRGVIGELQKWVAETEDTLRAGGVVFPEPATPVRPPSSWDEATGEFMFVIASTKPERSERLLGYAGPIAVDQVILPRGLVHSRSPMLVIASGGSGKATIGKVVRIWEEGGQILGRAMLLPEASAARAAVANGRVADVGWHFNVCKERVTQREGLRPLVTVEEWNLEGAVLICDYPDLGRLDPRAECPGKAKAV